MNTSRLLLLISTLIITFTACQKEKSAEIPENNGNTDGSELGTWNFISLHAITKETIEAPGEKLVTVSDYTTIDNKGTITFQNSKMSANNISFSVNSIAKAYYYANGVLEDSVQAPFAGTIPATSSTSDYEKIGADSIHLKSSTLSVPESGGSTGSGEGYKLRWEGNRMYMLVNYKGIRQRDVNGHILDAEVEIKGEYTLERP
jgi:hypothetical protein